GLGLVLKAAARASAWQGALEIFYEVSDLEIRSFNALLAALARRHPQQALALLPEKCQNSSVQALLGAAVAGAEWQHALVLLRRVPGDPLARSACASALARQRRWQRALALLESPPWDAGLLTAVLGALAREKRWRQAMQLLEADGSEEPNLEAYNAVMNATGWEWSLLLLANLDSLGLQADAFSFGACLAACGRAAQWQRALRLYEDMSWASVPADSLSQGALLHALSSSLRWREALRLCRRPLEVVGAMTACDGAQQQGQRGLLRLTR
ncbi:unnamed protein product, partial [Effrenium voratum]